MPFCEEKKLLFIHIPKTGGTSIEHSFRDFNKEIGVGIKDNKAMQHYTYFDYKKNLSEYFNNFMKFSIVRNPYSRIVSDFYFLNSMKDFKTFRNMDEYLDYAEDCINTNNFNRTIYDDHFMPQYYYLEDITNIKIFKTEKRGQLNNFLESYGLEIYHKNKMRKGVKPINLTREQANRINKLYRIDFKIFGYRMH